MLMRRIINPVVARLLRSRFHALAGRRTILLEVTGRRTGRVFAVPVTAVPNAEPGSYTVRTRAERRWWRNLRGGAAVRAWVGGSLRSGVGEVLEDGQAPVVSLRLD